MSNTVPIRRAPQSHPPQAAENKGRSSRKRLAQVHRGVREMLDVAVEARLDTEEISREYEVRREDVQDLVSWKTRQMVRQLQSQVRELERRMAEQYRRAA